MRTANVRSPENEKYPSPGKDQLVSLISHEMKTPVDAILSLTKEIMKTNLDDTQKGYLNAIRTSADALMVLVNGLQSTRVNIQAPNPEGVTNEIKKIRVLAAEDVMLNQMLMKTMIEEFGFEIDLVSNGREALEQLKKKSYDIVLLDLQMPEMSGLETAEYIRNTMHLTVPIIALSASIGDTDILNMQSAGIDDYAEKPLDEKLLRGKILKYMNGNKSMIDTRSNGAENGLDAPKYVHLDYLRQRTKNNTAMMIEMIEIYLKETPRLIERLKETRDNMDWDSLAATAHALIPSFMIMGISKDYEMMARTIQEYARKKEKSASINELVLKIEEVCNQAYKELKKELSNMKSMVRLD